MEKLIFIALYILISSEVLASKGASQTTCLTEALTKILNGQKGLVGEERQVLSRLMGKMQEVMGEKVYGLSDELTFKMDSIFTSELREKIKLLNPNQLKDLENIISRSQKDLVSNLSIGAYVKDIRNVEKMVIEINAFFANHPTTRIIMWHELDHVIDGVLKNSFKIKRLETSAFSAQYDYTRKVFSGVNLKELKEKFPTDVPDDLVERLKDAGTIKMEGSKAAIQVDKFGEIFQDQEKAKDFVDYLKRSALNAFFIEAVESALKMNKAEFLKTRLQPYKGQILRDRVSDAIKYGSGGIAGYYIYHKLTGDD